MEDAVPKNMFDQISGAVSTAHVWLPVAVGVLMVILLWLVISNGIKKRARIRQYEADAAARRVKNLPPYKPSLFD
jgi:heme exporter protein D